MQFMPLFVAKLWHQVKIFNARVGVRNKKWQ